LAWRRRLVRGGKERGGGARGTCSRLLEGLMMRGVTGASGGNGRRFRFPGREGGGWRRNSRQVGPARQ
jgi:hypothetical protein